MEIFKHLKPNDDQKPNINPLQTYWGSWDPPEVGEKQCIKKEREKSVR